MSNWGKGVNNNIGWGQGANNDIGWGSIYDKSNAGETLLSGGFEGFLNKFSGASLGLSLDKLDKNYTGFCIKVRRSSDNAELDIGFSNDVLDTASLLTFAGSGNAFVTIIYDQVGSNNMTQTTANRQGQIVSNGSVILKGGKPCIIRNNNNDGGYISTYAPNDGATFKGVFYVGQNSTPKSCLFGSYQSIGFSFISEDGNNGPVDRDVSSNTTKINGSTITISDRNDVYDETSSQFLSYRELNFNFSDNVLGLGYRKLSTGGNGMFTFQELVIFENTDDVVAKENNINSRYNIY